jgi:hypothetical protein
MPTKKEFGLQCSRIISVYNETACDRNTSACDTQLLLKSLGNGSAVQVLAGQWRTLWPICITDICRERATAIFVISSDLSMKPRPKIALEETWLRTASPFTRSWSVFLSNAPRFPEVDCFLNVATLRSFLLLRTVAFTCRWVWSTYF